MSVELGLDPASLLELDGPMFDALERAAARRWTVADELAAQSLELEHAHYRFTVAVHSKKNARLPEPLRVPRPDADDGFRRPERLSMTDFALEYRPAQKAGEIA